MEPYATVEYADTYLTVQIDTGVWSGADVTDKERALVTATVRIDALSGYGAGLRGCKADSEQPREFPRSPDSSIPDAVMRACCHEALALLEQAQDKTAAGRQKAIQQGVTSVSIGGVSESYAKLSDMQNGLRGCLLSDIAIDLIRPYLAVQGVFPIV